MCADRIQLKRGKSEKLVERLMALAHRLGPGAKFPTVREMCSRYDVAIVTLTGALAMLEARGAITRTHGHGIYVSEQLNRKSIALVLGHDIFDSGLPPFYVLFIQACRRTLGSLGYHVFYFADIPEASSAGSPFPVREDLVSALRDNLLDGLILAPQTSPGQGAWLRATGIPLVGLASSGEPGTFSVDYHAMIEMGVDALARGGCRRIALVSPFDYEAETGPLNPRPRDRDVFCKALAGHGLPCLEAAFLANHSVDGRNGPFLALGSASARELFQDRGPRSRPDGVVVLDDSVAAGFLPSVQTLGLRLGQDVRVATHTNLGVGILDPYVQTILRMAIDTDLVFSTAFSLLEARMECASAEPPCALIRPLLMNQP